MCQSCGSLRIDAKMAIVTVRRCVHQSLPYLQISLSCITIMVAWPIRRPPPLHLQLNAPKYLHIDATLHSPFAAHIVGGHGENLCPSLS